MSPPTTCPASRIAPIRTNSPPITVDWRRPRRGGWLMTGAGAPESFAGGRSSMRQPYAGRGCRQGPAPALGPHGGRRAEVVQHALGASRRSGEADPATVQDQAQAEPGPLLRRQHLLDLGFDLHRIGALG